MKKSMIFLDIFLGIFVFLAFILSLLPIISWWGGLLALPLAFYFWKYQKKGFLYKLSLLAIFLGLITHVICRAHSAWLVAKLKKEIIEKEEKIFSEKR